MQQSATLSEVRLGQTDPCYRSYQQTYNQTSLPGASAWTVHTPWTDPFPRSPDDMAGPPANHIRRYQVDQRRTDDAARFRDALWEYGSRGDCLNVDSYLLDRPNAINMPVTFDLGSTLHVAAMRGHSDLAQQLLHRKADVNCGNRARQTSLHAACEANQGPTVMELLAAGADTDQRDDCKQTPLHRAAFAGAEDAVQVLLDYGANIRLRDEGGLLPLHKAAGMGRSEAISMILERDPASVNAEADHGWTALHLAAHGGHAAACEPLLAYGADPNAGDAERMTALHRGATSGNEAVCQVLCRGGADIQATNNLGNTPLHTACEEGHAIVGRALLEMRAPVDALNSLRRSPLHLATEAGHIDLCEILVSFGANPDAMDAAKGVPSPVAIARRNRNVELMAMFEAATQASRGQL